MLNPKNYLNVNQNSNLYGNKMDKNVNSMLTAENMKTMDYRN